MSETIIKTKTMESGVTCIACETLPDSFSIEIAASCLFLHSEDIPGMLSLLHDIDKYFLRK